MKVKEPRLDSIRTLVKQLKTDKTKGAEAVGDSTGAAEAGGAKGTQGTGEVSAAGYGELHHSVEEQQLARDVQLVLQATDPARAGRIEALKTQIAAGEYQVDNEAVAERLMASGLFAEEA